MKISIVVGIILAMPVILYQLWAFVAPGLTPNERRIIRPWLPLALFFFALGVAIAYVVLPYAMAFLLGFTNETLVDSLAAGPYFDFVTTLFLAFGLVMEFPIILYGLSRVNILTSQRLKASRRYVILGITIFATVGHAGRRPRQPVRARRHDVPPVRGDHLGDRPRRPLSPVRRGPLDRPEAARSAGSRGVDWPSMSGSGPLDPSDPAAGRPAAGAPARRDPRAGCRGPARPRPRSCSRTSATSASTTCRASCCRSWPSSCRRTASGSRRRRSSSTSGRATW